MADIKMSEFGEITTPGDTTYIVLVSGGANKIISYPNLNVALKAILDLLYEPKSTSGYVIAPASNSDGKVPVWYGDDTKTLIDGLDVVTEIGVTGADTSIPTEQAVREALAAQPSNTVQMEVCWPEKPLDSGVISLWPPACTIPADLTGATYHGVVDPAAEAVVTLKKNGTSFGAATVAAGSTDVMTGSSTETSFNGTTDRLDIVFPAQDADWSGVSFKFQGVRS